MDPELLIIFITLIFSAYFSGMEIAFISSNRLKVELDRSKGTINGRILGTFFKDESHFIAMLLLGNNIALVIFGISAASLLDPIIMEWGIKSAGLILFFQTLFSTLLVLVTAEFLPRHWCKSTQMDFWSSLQFLPWFYIGFFISQLLL